MFTERANKSGYPISKFTTDKMQKIKKQTIIKNRKVQTNRQVTLSKQGQ